ncbi:hypothetical protein INR49_021910 [Caranx melampygus]|nr:hypothetical protein INR49_021910 [Caranx melampygus]
MEGLLGDENGDVSRRDVSPRDVSFCLAVARGQPSSHSTDRQRVRLQREQKQKATALNSLNQNCRLFSHATPNRWKEESNTGNVEP